MGEGIHCSEAALVCPVTVLLSCAHPVLPHTGVTWMWHLAVKSCSWTAGNSGTAWEELTGWITLVEVYVYGGPCVNKWCDTPHPILAVVQGWERDTWERSLFFLCQSSHSECTQNIDPRGTSRYVKSPSAPPLLCEDPSWWGSQNSFSSLLLGSHPLYLFSPSLSPSPSLSFFSFSQFGNSLKIKQMI